MAESSVQSLKGRDLRACNPATIIWRRADVRGADLRGVDLSGQDVSGADLRGTRLEGASLRDANLQDTDLSGAFLGDADLSGADLRRSVAFGVEAAGVRLCGARLAGAEWREARLAGADLHELRGTAWRLDRADLRGANLCDAHLLGAVLDDTQLEGCDFSGSDLRRAAITGVIGDFSLAKADLRGADIRGIPDAILVGARLEGARRQYLSVRLRGMWAELHKHGMARARQGRERFKDLLQNAQQRAENRNKQLQEKQRVQREQEASRKAAAQALAQSKAEARAQAKAAKAEATPKPIQKPSPPRTTTWERFRVSVLERLLPSAGTDVDVRLELRQIREVRLARDRRKNDRLVPREAIPEIHQGDLATPELQADLDARVAVRKLQFAEPPPAPLSPDLYARLAVRRRPPLPKQALDFQASQQDISTRTQIRQVQARQFPATPLPLPTEAIPPQQVVAKDDAARLRQRSTETARPAPPPPALMASPAQPQALLLDDRARLARRRAKTNPAILVAPATVITAQDDTARHILRRSLQKPKTAPSPEKPVAPEKPRSPRVSSFQPISEAAPNRHNPLVEEAARLQLRRTQQTQTPASPAPSPPPPVTTQDDTARPALRQSQQKPRFQPLVEAAPDWHNPLVEEAARLQFRRSQQAKTPPPQEHRPAKTAPNLSLSLPEINTRYDDNARLQLRLRRDLLAQPERPARPIRVPQPVKNERPSRPLELPELNTIYDDRARLRVRQAQAVPLSPQTQTPFAKRVPTQRFQPLPEVVPDWHDIFKEEQVRLSFRQGQVNAQAHAIEEQRTRKQNEARIAARKNLMIQDHIQEALKQPFVDVRADYRRRLELSRYTAPFESRLQVRGPLAAAEARIARAKALAPLQVQAREWQRNIRILLGTGAGASQVPVEIRQDAERDAIQRDQAILEGLLLTEALLMLNLRNQREIARIAAENVTAPVAPALPNEAQLRRRLRTAQQPKALKRPSPAPVEALQIGPGAKLSGKNLQDLKLRGQDLSGADLSRCYLVGADLRGTLLQGADLRDADLTDALLTGADLRDADLRGAILDEALFDKALLEGARFENARTDFARGLSPEIRQLIRSQGANKDDDEGSWIRGSSYMTVAALAAGILLYLGLQFTDDTVDPAALEHAAGEAQRSGNPDEAAENFAALATQQDNPDIKVNYLLEAAASAEESKDYNHVLELLEEALTIAKDGAMESTVQIRLAKVQSRAGLKTESEAGFRALLDRSDLQPAQQAEALVGLAGVCAPEALAALLTLQDGLLERAATDLERGALALALADGWSANNKPSDAKTVLDKALALMKDPDERASLTLRRARLLVDMGDSDGALLAFRTLVDNNGNIGMEARLGASELLVRRNALNEAIGILEPLLQSTEAEARARAMLLSAAIAQAEGDDTKAISLLQEVLKLNDLEPRRQDEARLLLGRILVRTDPAAAAALAANDPQLQEEMMLSNARVLRESGDRAGAQEIWAKLVDNETVSVDVKLEAQLSLADLQMENGDADAALSRFEALLKETENPSVRQRITMGMADALLRMGRLQEAETYYSGLVAVSGEEVAVRCRLGLAHAAEQRGQFEKATAIYLEVSHLDGPWALEALLSLGDMREKNHDLKGAAEALRLARTRPGAEAERRTVVDIHLARILEDLGDPEANTLYASLLGASDPEVRVQARLVVGEQVLAEDPARARDLYTEALAEASGALRADAQMGWIRATVATGDIDGAVERAKAWLSTEKDSLRRGELALAIIKALRVEGQLEEASTLIDQYASEGGFELAMEAGGVYRDKGDLDNAIRMLSAATAASAEDKVWRAESLLDALLLAGRWTDAASLCTELEALPGGKTPARLARAQLLREQGKTEEALALLEGLDDPRVPMERATLLQGSGRIDEAEALFRRMVQSTDPEQRSAGRVGWGRILLERGETERALALLDTEAIDVGYALTAAQIRGEALLSLGRLDEAKAVYAALSGDAEARTIGALGQGECALSADDLVAARTFFEQAQQSPDRFYQAHALAGLVRVAKESGEPSQADVLLQQLRSEYADREDAILRAQEP